MAVRKEQEEREAELVSESVPGQCLLGVVSACWVWSRAYREEELAKS